MRRAASIVFALFCGTVALRAAPPGSPYGSNAWVSRGPFDLSGVTTAFLFDPDDPARYIAATAGGLFRSSDAGASWTLLPAFDGVPVQALARDPMRHDVLYAGDSLGLSRSEDRGATWTRLSSTERWVVFSIAIAADSSRILVTRLGGLELSRDGGATWQHRGTDSTPFTTVRFHPADPLRALAAVGTGRGRVGGLSTRDGGETWTAVEGLDPEIDGLAFDFVLTDGSAMAYATRSGTLDQKLLRTDGDGSVFHVIGTAPTYGYSMRVAALMVVPRSPNVVLTGAIDVARSLDGGVTSQVASRFSGLQQAPHVDIRGIAADPAFDGVTNRRVVVWTDGGIYRTDDITASPVEWKHLANDLVSAQIYAFDIHRSGRIVLGMQDTGLAVMEPGSFAAEHLGDGDVFLTAFDPLDDHSYFVSVFGFGNGASGTVVEKWPPQAIFADAGAQQAASSGDWLIDPNEPRRMWVGGVHLLRVDGIQGELPQKTTSVRTYPTGTTVTAIAVLPGDSSTVFAADSTHTLDRTIDALAEAPKWSRVTQFDRNLGIIVKIVIDPDDAKTIYVLLTKSLQVSRDGGITWKNATATAPPAWVNGLGGGGLTDFARHPQRADSWYVGALGGLYASSDGGATWAQAAGIVGKVRIPHLRFAPGTSNLWVSAWSRGLWSLDLRIPVPPRRRSVGVH